MSLRFLVEAETLSNLSLGGNFIMAVQGNSGSHQIAHDWVYEGVKKPGQWSLKSGGGQQSPVRIDASADSSSPEPITTCYKAAPAKVKYKYPALEYYPRHAGEWGHLEIGCERWNLVKIHAHAKAEHSLFCHDRYGSPLLPAEIHFVHTRADSPDDRFLVLGVFARGCEDGEQPVVLPFLDHLRSGQYELTTDGLVLSADIALCPGCLLPGKRDYYSYQGSLTTPPCTENVDFLLLEQTIPVRRSQLEEFDELFPGCTNRPIQPSPDLEVRRNERHR